jgi:hypothetical protein
VREVGIDPVYFVTRGNSRRAPMGRVAAIPTVVTPGLHQIGRHGMINVSASV